MKKFLKLSSIFAIAVGILLVAGGVFGICFTYANVARERIVTPADAAISEKPVRGPLTLKAQAEVIREHVLARTEGKTYAEMTREEENRDLWITATTLTTALHLGLIAYAFSGFVALFGGVLIWLGIVVYALSRKEGLLS